MKQYADLTYVPPEQRPLDLRLHNWARWATVHGARFIQPMFKLYRPEEMRDEDRHQGKSAPIDASDALKIEKAVVALPDKHKLAVIWAYRSRANTKQACQIIGVTRLGLAGLIVDGRQMMVNRRV